MPPRQKRTGNAEKTGTAAESSSYSRACGARMESIKPHSKLCFYFLLGVWYLVVGGIMNVSLNDKYFYTEVIIPSYAFPTNNNISIITHYNDPAQFSSLPFPYLIVPCFYLPGSMYILIVFGSLLALACGSNKGSAAAVVVEEEEEDVEMEPDDGGGGEAESERSRLLQPSKRVQGTIGKLSISPDNYMCTALYFARALPYSVIGMIVTNMMVDKSFVAALFSLALYGLPSFIFYLGDGAYLFTQAEHPRGMTVLNPLKSDVMILMLFISHALALTFIAVPLATSCTSVGANGFPSSIWLAFILFMVLIAWDSTMHLLNLAGIYRMRWNKRMNALRGYQLYMTWMGMSHVVLAGLVGGFFIALEPALTTTGHSGL